MKMGRPLVEIDRLVSRISKALSMLRQANSSPSKAVDSGGQWLLRNLDKSEHSHWFFSGADLLCMPSRIDRAGDARGIVVIQATAPDRQGSTMRVATASIDERIPPAKEAERRQE